LSDPLYAITLAAADLKVVAPDQFNALVEAFRKLETKSSADFHAAGGEAIFGAQGKSVLMTLLRGRLENCLEQKNQVQKRG
jgi:hypothetical protein